MDTLPARTQAAEATREWRARLEATFGGRKRLADIPLGDPGIGQIMMSAGINALRGKGMDTQKPSLARWREIASEAHDQAELASKGFEWINGVQGQLERAPWNFKPEDRATLVARIATVRGKCLECCKRVDELEAQEEQAIREYLQAWPDGRVIIVNAAEQGVCFSVRPLSGAPYPVWTPAQIAAALRIGSLYTADQRKEMNFFREPLEFLANYGHSDPLEKARVACGKPKKHPSAKETPVSSADLFKGALDAEDNSGKGFGKL